MNQQIDKSISYEQTIKENYSYLSILPKDQEVL